MTHTSGPWRWTNEYPAGDGTDTWSLLGEGGFGILSCDGAANSPQNIRPDDAPLIAAAPDMLEALEKAYNFMRNHEASLGIPDGSDDETDTIKMVRAAIKKARS